MSKLALLFITLTVMLIIMDLLLPVDTQALTYATRIASGTFFGLFVIALMLGRRFKFDPVLR